MNPKLDQDLSDLWYNLDSDAAYSSLSGLLAMVKKKKLPYEKKEVREWLLAQPEYSVNYPRKYKFKRLKTIAYGVNWMAQMDLAHIPDLKWKVSNHIWLLVVCDIFSKKLSVRPMKSKEGKVVAKNLNDILEKENFELIQSDNGTEFFNKHVAEVFKTHGVYHFGTKTMMKASVVERAIRTLKSRIYRYAYKNNKRTFLSDLPKLINAINNTIHSSHKFKPNEVSIYNQDIVFQRLYPDFYKNPKYKIPFKVGDRVRIAKQKQPFSKGYRQTYTEQVFIVSEVIKTRAPPVYKLKDSDENFILGIFYAEELLKIK